MMESGGSALATPLKVDDLHVIMPELSTAVPTVVGTLYMDSSGFVKVKQ